MLGGRLRVSRAIVLFSVLVLGCAACEINVRLLTKVNADGSGRFSLRFLIDEELVQLASNSGEDLFAALECPSELVGAGWECNRSTEGGGISIRLERPFRSADEFNDSMEQLERLAAEQEGPTAQFFRLRIARDGGFFRSRTTVEGSVDLTATGVLGRASASSRDTLEAIIEQAGGEFFTFDLEAVLPGSVSTATGDPESVRGGTVTWTPRLGGSMSFLAESAGYNVTPIALVGGPSLAVIALLAWMLVRRRRPATPAD